MGVTAGFIGTGGGPQAVTTAAGEPVGQGYQPGNTAYVYGQVAAPSAAGVIATIAAGSLNNSLGGVYEVVVEVALAGTIASPTDLDNFQLLHGATVVGRLIMQAVALGARQVVRFPRVTVAAAESLSVQAVANSTASSIYRASITATLLD